MHVFNRNPIVVLGFITSVSLRCTHITLQVLLLWIHLLRNEYRASSVLNSQYLTTTAVWSDGDQMLERQNQKDFGHRGAKEEQLKKKNGYLKGSITGTMRQRKRQDKTQRGEETVAEETTPRRTCEKPELLNTRKLLAWEMYKMLMQTTVWRQATAWSRMRQQWWTEQAEGGWERSRKVCTSGLERLTTWTWGSPLVLCGTL